MQVSGQRQSEPSTHASPALPPGEQTLIRQNSLTHSSFTAQLCPSVRGAPQLPPPVPIRQSRPLSHSGRGPPGSHRAPTPPSGTHTWQSSAPVASS